MNGRIGALKRDEVAEADRIVRVAFGTFLGMPNPAEFMGDRDFMTSRWRSKHVKVLAARDGGRLIGSNVITRWGSFAFFGPLTVLPEYWNQGVAKRLMEATVKIFDDWGLRHSGLFTFANSAKHVGLYQKFGYWPRYLTAIMTYTPVAAGVPGVLLSTLDRRRREEAITECSRLTARIYRGLDLAAEIRALLGQGTGEVVMTYRRGRLDGFAVCMTGRGSEGGSKTCYIKFGAASGGAGADERFDGLLSACESFAAARGTAIEAGVNLAREGAYGRMRDRGYRATTQGVAMSRPNVDGFERPDCFVMNDGR
ncbi:MAG TPA: GNAT family N-acetyltransferase [Verrucomicrobiae bacterium]|nr:GNAT family N-acetyltransferase [Verrucomicrobiae bacterium]